MPAPPGEGANLPLFISAAGNEISLYRDMCDASLHHRCVAVQLAPLCNTSWQLLVRASGTHCKCFQQVVTLQADQQWQRAHILADHC